MTKLTNTFSEIDAALKQYNMKNAVIWMGIDSLTAGAGGVSYNVPFEKFARGVSGWGGRWIPFEPNQTFGEMVDGFKTGQTDIRSTLDRSDIRRAMSLDGKGAYSDSVGTRFTYELIPNFNWSEVDIYYLNQPSGGTLTVDYPTDGGTPTIDTSGTYSIGVITVKQSKKAGQATSGSASHNIRLNNLVLDGPVCIYGAVFRSGDGGPIFINAATGGQKTSEFTEYDGATQSAWFDLLGVTHAIMNAGTNDRATSTPSEFETDLRELCGRFDSKVEQYIVNPNETDGGVSPFVSVYTDVASDFGTLIDLPSLFGDYASNNSAGRMLDGTHPNEQYQYYQAQHYCKLLFGNALYVETPPIIDYTAGDTQSLIDGSYRSLISRITALEP